MTRRAWLLGRTALSGRAAGVGRAKAGPAGRQNLFDRSGRRCRRSVLRDAVAAPHRHAPTACFSSSPPRRGGLEAGSSRLRFGLPDRNLTPEASLLPAARGAAVWPASSIPSPGWPRYRPQSGTRRGRQRSGTLDACALGNGPRCRGCEPRLRRVRSDETKEHERWQEEARRRLDRRSLPPRLRLRAGRAGPRSSLGLCRGDSARGVAARAIDGRGHAPLASTALRGNLWLEAA
jgi:hypothetical protein